MEENLSNGRGASTVLVVDDNPLNRELTSDLLLAEGFNLVLASDGFEALEVLGRQDVDVILLDVMMPRMNGLETCRLIKKHYDWRLIPVVMLTSLSDVSDRVQALEAGADDFLSKPFDHQELLARVGSSVRLKQVHDQLEDTERVLFALANVVESKDSYTDFHLKRVVDYSQILAKSLDIPSRQQTWIYQAAILHDIGKVGISDLLLNKPGKLTSEEFSIMKTHSVQGEKIVRPMRFGKQVGPIIRGHHERWDGQGYPDGLSGENIPLGARVIALADTFDAMTSDRPYRKALSRDIALDVIQKNAGHQFDPKLTRLFLSHTQELQILQELSVENYLQ